MEKIINEIKNKKRILDVQIIEYPYIEELDRENNLEFVRFTDNKEIYKSEIGNDQKIDARYITGGIYLNGNEEIIDKLNIEINKKVEKEKEVEVELEEKIEERIENIINLPVKYVINNPEMIDRLKEIGINQIILNVVSYSEETRIEFGCDVLKENILKAVKILKDRKMEYGVEILVGLEENEKDELIFVKKMFLDLQKIKDIKSLVITQNIIEKETKHIERFYKGEFIPLTIEEAKNITEKIIEIAEKNGIEKIILKKSFNIKDVENMYLTGPYIENINDELRKRIIYKDVVNQIQSVNFKIQTGIIIIKKEDKELEKLILEDEKILNKIEEIYSLKLLVLKVSEEEYNQLLKERKRTIKEMLKHFFAIFKKIGAKNKNKEIYNSYIVRIDKEYE